MKRSAGLLFVSLLMPLALGAQVVAYDFSKLYEKASPAIVQITTDDGTGSGFLVSPFGHIATNFHVIRNSRYLAVQFPDGRKVKADIVAVNGKYDMALLKVNSHLVANIRPLQLLPQERESDVKVGIPVVALGSPLNQKFLMTQGILSKVGRETVLGDFLLQAGHSGGPLINMDGQVLGINTFAEGSIAGAVRIGTLRDLLKTEDIWDSRAVEPSPELLPALSSFRYPVEILNLKIQTEPFNVAAYRFKAGDFEVTAITPVLIGKLQLASGKVRQENRQDRRGKLSSDPQFHMSDDQYYEWHETTETALDFAVTFDIRPSSGLTKRSKFSRFVKPILKFGRTGPLDMEFKGEFLDFRIYRDGQLIEPIQPGRSVIQGSTEKNRFVDEAAAGSYVYTPDDFMTGSEFRFQIVDARRPDEIHKEVILAAESDFIRQIRSDFSISPDFLFVRIP